MNFPSYLPSFRHALLGTTVLAMGLTGISTASAQDTAAAKNPAEDIVVTGTRVQRDGYSAPTPTTVMSVESLTRTAPGNIADAVNQLPALSGSTTPRTVNNSATGTGGANLLNLRNLGTTRSLVLLDGRRVAASTATGGVDINMLPTALLKRVDVVTGGASAAYGSDAVAGVVNFVLDDKFQGIKGTIQSGISQQGDGADRKFDLSAGTKFAGGRGHIIVSGSYDKTSAVNNAGSRSWYQGNKIVNNPAYTAGGTASQYIVANNVGIATATPYGLITTGSQAGTMFNGDGTTSRFTSTNVSSLLKTGGTDNDFARQIQLQPDQTNYNLFGHASFDLTDNITAFGELSYAYSHTVVQSVPYFRFGNVTIKSDNAYLPASVKTALANAGESQFTMGTWNSGTGGAVATANRKMLRWVGGLEGKIDGGWKWNVYYQDGLSKIHNAVSNNIITSRYNLAIDAVSSGGSIVCRSTLTDPSNGCVALNPFGTASAAALGYVMGTAIQDTRIHEQVASGSISGEPFSTWAGPVSLAMGAEYRHESFGATADAISQLSGFWLGNYKPSGGSYAIKEAFGEVVVPLLKDSAIAKSLDLNGAVRVTDYSTSGTVATWKAGLTWAINRDIALRGTRSRDIRAPNFNDLYQGGSSTSSTVIDRTPGSTGTAGATVSTLIVSKGNAALKPEVATTWAGGVVLTPSFLRGFSASLDYYDIRIKDAITTPTQQQVMDGCFGGNATYCGFITRDSTGLITQIVTPGVNANEERVRGLDVDASYRHSLGMGQLSVRALATFVFEHTITSAFTGGKYNYVGDYGGTIAYSTPGARATASVNYNLGDFDATLAERFISAGRISNAYTTAQLANNHVPAVFYTDLNLSYTIHGLGGSQKLFLSVQNLFDRAPPVAPSTTGNAYGNIGTNTALYDIIGRYFTAGLKFQF